MSQPGLIFTVADLARASADSLFNATQIATESVVVIIHVRRPDGTYGEAAVRQVDWQDWLVANIVPGPSPEERARRSGAIAEASA